MTASDLPGTGRVMGNLFSKAGRALERRVGRFRRRNTNSTSSSSDAGAQTESSGSTTLVDPQPSGGRSPSFTSRSDDDNDTSDVRTITNFSDLSFSTNETASNIAGPGRMLGIFYSRAGKSIESKMNVLAKLAKVGPDARYRRIKEMMMKDFLLESQRMRAAAYREIRDLLALAAGPRRDDLDAECKKLLKYTKYVCLSAFRVYAEYLSDHPSLLFANEPWSTSQIFR